MPRPNALTPAGQFPSDALDNSVQTPPDVINVPTRMLFTWNIASVADSVTPWGRNIGLRDRQLRDFWPTEPFLAGALASVSFKNAGYDWKVEGKSDRIEQILTDIFNSAIAGDSFGWTNFILKLSQDLYSQDNGAFVELIRDPTVDAGSKFKEEKAPVLGIAHLDSNQCIRTGNPEYPVIYTDRQGKNHQLTWYQVIPFSDYPSSIEKMNGVGVCAVSRTLRLSQIMRSIAIFKDEKISGRHYKSIHLVSGPSRSDIADIMNRGKEEADNSGQLRYIDPAILASLDPEKPVSVATIDLANLPDGFNFDEEMKWYITGLALDFGVDYQEFAPLMHGSMGSGNQANVMQRKSASKGPAMFMKIAEAFSNYGVMPQDYEMVFETQDEQREQDRQNLLKAFEEEMTLAIRSGLLDHDTARKIAVERGFYSQKDIDMVPKGYGLEVLLSGKQPFGNSGGNTFSEDASRTNVGIPNVAESPALQKERMAEYEDRKDERRSFLSALKDIANDFRIRPITKEKSVPSVLSIDVHNHPGEKPVINLSPELKATTRLILPKQEKDHATAEALEKLAKAVSEQKPSSPIINVPPANTKVEIFNQLPKDDQAADRKEFIRKFRDLNE
jgi:hypothetical protein